MSHELNDTCPLPKTTNGISDEVEEESLATNQSSYPSKNEVTSEDISENGTELIQPSVQVVSSPDDCSYEKDQATTSNISGPKRIGSPELQSLLLHIPEMNLPWHHLRGVTKCTCGVAFSFTRRKVCLVYHHFIGHCVCVCVLYWTIDLLL